MGPCLIFGKVLLKGILDVIETLSFLGTKSRVGTKILVWEQKKPTCSNHLRLPLMFIPTVLSLLQRVTQRQIYVRVERAVYRETPNFFVVCVYNYHFVTLWFTYDIDIILIIYTLYD